MKAFPLILLALVVTGCAAGLVDTRRDAQWRYQVERQTVKDVQTMEGCRLIFGGYTDNSGTHLTVVLPEGGCEK